MKILNTKRKKNENKEAHLRQIITNKTKYKYIQVGALFWIQMPLYFQVVPRIRRRPLR